MLGEHPVHLEVFGRVTMKKKKIRCGLLFAAPVLLGTALFFAIPFGMVVGDSFSLGGQFVGLENYIKVLSSESFRLAAWNTARFLVIGVPLVLCSALALALLFLAALNMIPKEYYQYAQLSGGNGFQQLWYITLPQLRPTLGFTAVIAVINSFKSYREAFLLGGKHPTQSIYLLQHFLNNNFENLSYSRLSVASVLLALPIMLAAVVVLICWRRHGDEA